MNWFKRRGPFKMAVYEELILHITPEKFYIEPLDNRQEVLVIDRVTQEITLEGFFNQIPLGATRKTIYGIIGIIRLLAGPYLVVITKKIRIGDIHGQPVWRVAESEVHSYSRTLLHLTERQIQDNRTFLSMIQFVLQIEYYYFSSTYDLTHTLQRLHNTTPEFLQMPLHERADQRFVWNGHLLRDLTQQSELNRYCLPLLHGFVSIRTCTLNQKTFSWILISRRSCFRAGTRFFMRGLDSEGHAANFVETEQIVEYNNNRCSFVQTRGSIPLFWSQKPNLSYLPNPQISTNLNHLDGFSRHFDNQIFNYGRQIIVNLINHTGREMNLEKTYSELVTRANNANIIYVSFDFHHQCRHMKWERLSILMEQLTPLQKDFGYFLMFSDGSVPMQQDGVFRTNCMDCLDRTNVVQSLLAYSVLRDQLQTLGILGEGQQIEDEGVFHIIYKNVWADNADICSIQYAGTGALKTDFTRTGKRTIAGAMKDGVNAAMRYYKNNFSDGFRQDAIDLFLGNYTLEENEAGSIPSPLQEQKDWKYLALPVIALVAIAMCFMQILIPAEYTTETLLSFLFWLGMFIVSLIVMYYYGSEYVDQPKLCEVRKKRD